MLRKVGLVSALLLAVPAFANAWTVTAKIGSGAGQVVSGTPAKTIAKPGTFVGYYKAVNGVDADQTFTVDPAAGFSISSVIVNGAAVVPAIDVDGTGTVVVAAGNPIKNSQSLVAYFKQNLLSVDAVQAAGGKVTVQRCNADGSAVYGSLSMTGLAGLKAGSFVKVTAMPNSDYSVVSVAGDVLATGLQGDVVSTVVPVVDGADLTAVFALASIAKPVVTVSKNVALPNEVLSLDATKTVANKAVAKYTFSATPATGVTFNPTTPYVADATGKATVKFAAEGDYAINVEVEFADGSKFDSVVDARVKVATGNSCMTCHNNRNAALMTSVQSGKHSFGLLTGHSSGNCQRCHSTEGYNAYAATTGVDFVAQTGYTAIADKDAAGNIILTNVGCYACHNNHDSVLRDTPAQWDPKYAADGASATQQFKLCTSCHGLVNGAGAPIASGQVVSGTTTVAMQKHNTDWYRNIGSTHYDLPSTGVGLTTTYVEGYNIRYNKESACTDCHGHDFYTNTEGALRAADPEEPEYGVGTVYTDWAGSAHAGGLLKAKAAKFEEQLFAKNAVNAGAIMAVGVTGTTGPAWEHYSWDDSGRSACQKCHTSTGVSNYLDAVNTFNKGGAEKVFYDATKNDFGHLVGWTTTATTKTSTQNEMLYCWGCHNNAGTGALRVEGAMTLDYKAVSTDTTNIVLAAAGNGKSAACISCHAGRGNVVSLMGAATIDPAAVLGAATTPKNSATATSTHYLNAAATIFKNETKVGYEFPALSYDNPSYYKHKNLGCADCHMPNKSHKFEVVKKDAAGVITELVATKCIECHSGAHGTALLAGSVDAAAFIEEEAEGYKQALAAFNNALIAQGYTWTSSHPYFTFTSADPTVAAKKWRTQGDLGAGHNYNYLLHEPGAYAHNMMYAKRLIFDSMDWLDNGIMNGAVDINADLQPEAAVWFGAAAGTTGTYSATRP